MKKTILSILLFTALSVSAQEKQKQDTTIQITVSIEQFRALLYTIDVNIDSKKTSKELLDFLQKNARILQPADKPKQPK